MEKTTIEMKKTNIKNLKWYAIRIVSGKEKKAIELIKSELSINKCDNYVNQILLPQEDEIKIRNGKKIKRTKITIPGYIFIECNALDNVVNTIKLTNFVADWTRNTNGKPQAIRQSEIDRIFGRIEENSKGEIPFIVGEEVKIIDGPFSTFSGAIDTIDMNKQQLKVNVSVFGRPTPVELNFLQVERIKD